MSRTGSAGPAALVAATLAVTLAACRSGAEPAVALDEQIAYTSIPERMMRLVTSAVDGSSPTVITAETQTNLEPTYSPDGSRILFTSWRDGDANIWVMDRDGSNARGLTADTANDRSARFSPDGSKIAFVSQREGPYDIYLMNPDGSGVTNLTRSPNSVDWEPRWSPDGTAILYTSTRGASGIGDEFSLWIAHLDGSGFTRLPVDGGVRWPAWSPDGTRIAFVSDRSGDDEIWVMNADGSNQVNITNTPGVDDEPFWSPDGTRILFTSDRDGSTDIYVMGADGSNVTRVTTTGHWVGMPSWSP